MLSLIMRPVLVFLEAADPGSLDLSASSKVELKLAGN